MNVFRNMLHMACRFKTATVLNFLGLTVAFAACYLFLTQVTYNHSYHKGLTNYQNLYRVEVPAIMDNSKWQSNVTRFLAEQLDSMPQVESMALMHAWYDNQRFQKDNTEFEFTVCAVTNQTLVTLAPRVLDGQIGWTDNEQEGFVIPASIAM